MEGATASPVQVEPVRPELDGRALASMRDRLAEARLPAADLAGAGPDEGWELGTPGGWLVRLAEDWRAFDAGTLQATIDGLPHLRAVVDGIAVHAVRVEGRGTRPLPLLLSHGWPGSFLEYLDLIGPLTDPGAYGGDPADSFTVIVPSLPGYGFSGRPPRTGFPPRAVAGLLHRLMCEGLGYERYVAHGSDLGAGITAWLARDHPGAVAGIHLATPGLAPAPRPWSPAEEAYAGESEAWMAEEGGYYHQHATRPLTLAAGLGDSPLGLAAWVGEKVRAWSPASPAAETATRTFLLRTLTLYWVTDTIGTSLLPYWARRHSPGAGAPPGAPPPTPTAVTNFGGEQVPFPKPPRELAARYYSLSAWAEHDRGGHFPAVHEPALLAARLREVFRPLRGTSHR
jgi:pimeloyl-ACP methyl ester carboxylesterase